jgi:transcriptional regulator with XRE-family HTH domain
MKFGDFIKKTRKSKGLTQKHVADETKISAVYLLEIEKNIKPAPLSDKLYLLADAIELKNKKEIHRFFDLAAKTRDSIPADIERAIKNNSKLIPEIRKFIKKVERQNYPSRQVQEATTRIRDLKDLDFEIIIK